MYALVDGVSNSIPMDREVRVRDTTNGIGTKTGCEFD